MLKHEVFITIIKTNLPGLKKYLFIFYEVTQTRKPPYCFSCIITLVKQDKFPINKFETALLLFSGHLFSYLGPLSLCAQKHFHYYTLMVFIICYRIFNVSYFYNICYIIGCFPSLGHFSYPDVVQCCITTVRHCFVN